MTYRKKVTLLSVITGSLALLYALLLVFNPDRVAARNDFHTWLDPKAAAQADRIEVRGGPAPVNLVRRQDGLWQVEGEGESFPAKAARVEELLSLLSARGSYPVRGNSASAHDRLGLGADASRRVLLRRSGEPLIELLAGDYDGAGQEVYYRRAGRDEVRSGPGDILRFLTAGRASWYDLRLFPGDIPVTEVSRVTVIPPAEEGEAQEPLVIGRDQSGWFVEGAGREGVDAARVDGYVRSVLTAEGEDYADAGEDGFSAGRIVLETGGGNLYIRLGEELPREGESAVILRRAKVSPSDRVVSLSSWTVDRLFRTAGELTAAPDGGIIE